MHRFPGALHAKAKNAKGEIYWYVTRSGWVVSEHSQGNDARGSNANPHPGPDVECTVEKTAAQTAAYATAEMPFQVCSVRSRMHAMILARLGRPRP